MIILPAIDIYQGKAVRLVKGDYATAGQVADSPYEAAQSFVAAGASWMHMVDLDGAKDAKLVNAELIADVAKSSGLSVEVGGGIRDMKAVEYYLSHGVNRVILGSAAVKNPQLVRDAVKAYNDRIVVGWIIPRSITSSLPSAWRTPACRPSYSPTSSRTAPLRDRT